MDYNRFPKPSQFTSQITELTNALSISLAEYNKIYVIAKMNVDNEDYQQQLSNVESNITQIQSKVNMISNDVLSNIDNINTHLYSLYSDINTKRKVNADLKRKLGIVDNEQNASAELIQDYKQIYNEHYIKNMGMLFSIAICLKATHYFYTQSHIHS